MTKNVVNFPSDEDGDTPKSPDNRFYEVTVRTPDGGTVVVKQEGYLVATGHFIAICQGPYGKSEFLSLVPMNEVVFATSTGLVGYTGKLDS